MNWKNLQRFGFILVFSVILYFSFNGMIEFYSGYHNGDLAHNFINQECQSNLQDLNTKGQFVSLHSLYIQGRYQIKNGFNWIIFCICLSLILNLILISRRFF